MTAMTSQERTAAFRERDRKAKGYDTAVAERDAATERATALEAERDAARSELEQLRTDGAEWVRQAQQTLDERNNTISLQQQQIAQLRAQLHPIAEPATRQHVGPVTSGEIVVRCNRCGGVNKVKPRNNQTTEPQRIPA